MTQHSSLEVRIPHEFLRHRLDADALWIIHHLREAGYVAYLVGGCIRDLLTGLRPKDFDIATSARPNQIKRLFRSCRIIGRRFRLAHVRVGGKIIEVSTFRGMAQNGDSGSLDWSPVHSDNVFGSPDEDAMRRDFTINGLFYDVARAEIIDFVGGLSDLKRRTIRAIGDAEARMREDPVRMIRALKLAGRVDFSIDPPLAEAVRQQAHLIRTSAPARILEELFKILASGAASTTVKLLHDYGLLKPLLPEVAHCLDRGDQDRVYRFLNALDAADQGLRLHSNAVLLATLLMPLIDVEGALIEESAEGAAEGLGSYEVNQRCARLVRGSMFLRNLPRRDLHRLGHILNLQRRLSLKDRTAAKPVVLSEAFGDALALFRISAYALELPEETVRYWEECAASYPMADRHEHFRGADEDGLDVWTLGGSRGRRSGRGRGSSRRRFSNRNRRLSVS